MSEFVPIVAEDTRPAPPSSLGMSVPAIPKLSPTESLPPNTTLPKPPAIESEPYFSPDGKSLVYTSDSSGGNVKNFKI